MKGLGIGLLLSTFVKVIVKLFNLLLTGIAYALLYFGLWIPTVYMIFSGILMLWLGLDLAKTSVETNLFFWGLALALACSVIITVKNMLVRPIIELKDYKKKKREYNERKHEAKRRELYKKNPAKYYAAYGDRLPDRGDVEYKSNRRKRAEGEPAVKPKIYRSEVNPQIIIHEYRDRFEIYRDTGDRLIHVDTKSK